MAAKKKSWSEKFTNGRTHEVKRLDKAFSDMPEGCLMLIATPAIVDDYMRHIPRGKEVSVQTIRNDLAA